MIAVVDDHADTASAVVRLIKKGGRDAAAFESCEEFLAALPNQKPDLVILDIMMPKMNGMDCLRIIRSTPEWKDIPVVVYSADYSHERLIEAKRLGAQDFVVKGAMHWADFAKVIEQYTCGSSESN